MRAAIVISLCLGMSAVAHAGTTSLEVPGEPRVVDVWRPGVFSVATSDGVYLYIDNQLIGLPLTETSGVGTFLTPMNCIAAVNRLGQRVSSEGCLANTGDVIVPLGPVEDLNEVLRVMHTPSGRGYALANLVPADFKLLTSAQGVVAPGTWTGLLTSNGSQRAATMGVTETRGGIPHAVFAVFPTELIWFQDERQQARAAVPLAVTPRILETVDISVPEGLNPFVLFANGDGLFRGPLAPAPAPSGPFTPVEVQAPFPVTIKSVDLNIGDGSVRGEGFGLAVGLGPVDAPVVLGAVPAGTAAEAGRTWRVHSGIGGSTEEPTPEQIQVSCIGASYCVIAYAKRGGNVTIYSNDEAPVIDVGTSPLAVDERGDAERTVSALDLDGDAVRLSVDASVVAGLLDVTAMAPSPDVDALRVSVTAREVCKDETVMLPIWASDGLASHDASRSLEVTINNANGPGAPTVSPASARLSAGGTPVRFTATPAPGVCETVAYQWAASGPGQPVLTLEAGAATVTPPDFLCEPQGRSFTYTVTGQDVGGQASDATSFTVDVAPWGKPLPPFATGATRTLSSATATQVDLSPEVLHPCDGTEGLPTVETQWRLAGASTGLPAGITVRRPDGTPVDFSSPVTSRQLRVEAAACTRATLSLAALNRIPLAEGGQQEGPESTVQVSVAPPVEDFSSASLTLGVQPVAERQVDVTLGTSLVCPAPSVKARMRLVAPDGSTVDSDDAVAVPGTWRPEIPSGCAPTTYRVQGALYDDSTQPEQGAGTAEVPLPVAASPVELGPLEGGTLVARCEEGASATLTQTIPPEACGDVQLSWERLAGPALAVTQLTGRSVTVATQDTGLDALVGRTLRLGVTASAPDGTLVRREHEVLITAEPFVDVRHDLESPTGSEKDLVGVVVELRNTTACGVRGLRFVERVAGLEPVPGSVKLDGQPVADRTVEGGFEVQGLELPARGSGMLTYVARPQLLTSPRFDGQMYRESVLVSGPVPEEATSGCGCSGGGSGAAVFGLAALARLLRRRRR